MWTLVLTLTLIFAGSEATVTCRNNNDGVVDWYILYKAPRTSKLTGLEYIYVDSNGPTIMSSSTSNYKAINHPEGVLANTLKPLFMPIRSMHPNFGFISYSDNPPGCKASKSFGHSKGVVMVDRTDSGVWLLHSTPQFPYKRNKSTFWPDSGGKNGQIFICVTFPYAQFRNIGNHLQYIRAFPFEHDIPEQFHGELKEAANREVLPVNNAAAQTLHSQANMVFYSIAKRAADQLTLGDLYGDIGQLVKSDLMVQTWGCQPGYDRSSCIEGRSRLFNIKTIKTNLGEWANTKDHSKWCIATNLNINLVCIADMNRSTSQYQRYGGALCINNPVVKQIFGSFVKNVEDCRTINLNAPNADCDDVDY